MTKFTQNWKKNDKKLAKNDKKLTKCDKKLLKNWPKVGQKLPKIDQIWTKIYQIDKWLQKMTQKLDFHETLDKYPKEKKISHCA